MDISPIDFNLHAKRKPPTDQNQKKKNNKETTSKKVKTRYKCLSFFCLVTWANHTSRMSPLGTLKIKQEFYGNYPVATEFYRPAQKRTSYVKIPPVIMDPPVEKGPLTNLFSAEEQNALGIEVHVGTVPSIQQPMSPIKPTTRNIWNQINTAQPFAIDTPHNQSVDLDVFGRDELQSASKSPRQILPPPNIMQNVRETPRKMASELQTRPIAPEKNVID